MNFNITKFDPDGTIPDAYWYVDNKQKQYNFGNVSDEFNFVFGCGVSGDHKIKAEITDGLLNDSVTWNVSVTNVPCPSPGPGGGGGGGGLVCSPSWGCNPWEVCQNAQLSLEEGFLSGYDYRIVQQNCTDRQLTDERCGVQIRNCNDLRECTIDLGKPDEAQACLYIADPSCSDGVKNCHDGECEILIDCGGSCERCPSCSDGIKNQGEEGVDCGGACPWQCVPAVPLLKRGEIIYGFFFLLLLIIAFVIYKLIRVLKYKKKLKAQAAPKI